MQAQVQVATHVGRPTVTLHQVLRHHSLGEFQNYDPSDLREFKAILSAKIQEVYHTIRTRNLYKTQVEELRNDIRWYLIAETEIDALLTAQFHAKA